ncbi:MAG: HRDC domain-containing protein [Gammaproteobacteria bacterium]|nr:HRDC domain-containing protein [Gammaproteobacteria bacterium]
MNAANGNSVLFIDNSTEFEALVSYLSTLPSIGLDTEFVRTNTFYAKLGLVQISDLKSCYLIDPRKIENWNSFAQLLENSDIPVIIHSSSEDLSVLKISVGGSPSNLFDSQLASAFLGEGFSLSYQALVKLKLDVDLDKNETRSDWLKRPLSTAQIKYAADDVCYLLALKEILEEQLGKTKKLEWFREECRKQVKTMTLLENQSQWEISYANINKAWALKRPSLEHLQQLCVWRELKARESDKPRNWIAKDKDLLNLALALTEVVPLSRERLNKVELESKNFMRDFGDEILALIKQPRSNLSPVDEGLLNYPLTSVAKAKLRACQTAVSEISKSLSIAPELLGRKRALQEFIRDFELHGELHWSGEFSGWRKEALEEKFVSIFKAS